MIKLRTILENRISKEGLVYQGQESFVTKGTNIISVQEMFKQGLLNYLSGNGQEWYLEILH